VIFFVLLWVLKRWAWGPLVQQLHQREKTILDAVANAEQREQEATDLMNFYKAKLEAAEIDAQEVINTSRREAGQVRDQILTTAREEARKSADSARQEVERAKEDALRSLHQSTAELATDIAGRVLKKDLSPDDQRRLLEHSLAEIRKQAKKE
jgi:F-type H+-transporting ATPase subunit b